MADLPPVNLTDRQDVEDELDQVISDSIDMDWTSRTGARAIQRWLDEHGFVIVPVAPIRETAELLRSYERHHREQRGLAYEMPGQGATVRERGRKAQRNADAAAKLEALLP